MVINASYFTPEVPKASCLGECSSTFDAALVLFISKLQ